MTICILGSIPEKGLYFNSFSYIPRDNVIPICGRNYGVSIRLVMQNLAFTTISSQIRKKGRTMSRSAISFGKRKLPPRQTSFSGCDMARYTSFIWIIA